MVMMTMVVIFVLPAGITRNVLAVGVLVADTLISIGAGVFSAVVSVGSPGIRSRIRLAFILLF